MGSSARNTDIIKFADYTLDLETAELCRNGTKIVLQDQPFQILTTLIESPRRLVTREELIKKLWPTGTFVDYDQSLNRAVARLREALGDDAEEPRFVETLPRKGYRFVGELEPSKVDSGETCTDVNVSSLQQMTLAVSPCDSEPSAKPPEKPSIVMVLAVLLISVISIALVGFLRRRVNVSAGELQLTKLTDNRKAEGVAISPDGRYVAYVVRQTYGSGIRVRQVATRSSDVEIVSPSDLDLVGLTFSNDSNYLYFVRANNNGVASLFVTPVLGGPARSVLRDVDSPVSFSPDGHRFAFTRSVISQNAIELRIAESDGSRDHLLATFRNTAVSHQSGPSWSQDGSTIVLSRMSLGRSETRWTLEAVSLADGAISELYSNRFKIGRPLWMPASNGLLVALDDRDNHGQLYVIAFPHGARRRLTNDLADYEDDLIDLTRDGKTAAIVAWDVNNDIWEAPASTPTKMTPLQTNGQPLFSIGSRTDGKILATSLDNMLWIINADGTQRTLFTDVGPADAPFSCGRFIFFFRRTIQGDSQGLMRAEADGSDVTELIHGHVESAACSADGSFLVHLSQDSPQKIVKVPVDGGVAVDVASIPNDVVAQNLILSTNGRLMAYLYHESIRPTMAADKLAIIHVEGGAPPLRVFSVPRGISSLHWSPDGKGVQYSVCPCVGAATNIWEQSLAGGQPTPVTNFTSGRIFDFNWSANGQYLLLIRGELNGDVVLVNNLHSVVSNAFN